MEGDILFLIEWDGGEETLTHPEYLMIDQETEGS